ncbi:hypothetical protein D3C85_1332880 [compost metagenome]
MARREYRETSGPAVSGNAGFSGHSAAATPASPAIPAANHTHPRANRPRARVGRWSANARRKDSVSNGACRRRTPVALWMALAMAAAAGKVTTPSTANCPCFTTPSSALAVASR